MFVRKLCRNEVHRVATYTDIRLSASLDVHDRKLSNRFQDNHERALRIVYGDYNKYFTILYRTIKTIEILATEIHKTKNGISPEIMNEIFSFKEPSYNF